MERNSKVLMKKCLVNLTLSNNETLFDHRLCFSLRCDLHSEPVSRVPQCAGHITSSVSLCSRGVRISVAKWCIAGGWSGAVWDLEERSIPCACLFLVFSLSLLLPF